MRTILSDGVGFNIILNLCSTGCILRSQISASDKIRFGWALLLDRCNGHDKIFCT